MKRRMRDANRTDVQVNCAAWRRKSMKSSRFTWNRYRKTENLL